MVKALHYTSSFFLVRWGPRPKKRKKENYSAAGLALYFAMGDTLITSNVEFILNLSLFDFGLAK